MKLGQLLLDGGRWNGRQMLSKEWVACTLEAHAGLHGPDDYGYGWHRATYRSGGQTYAAFQAAGNGGQLLLLIPDLDLVVMITAANYGDYRTWPAYFVTSGRPNSSSPRRDRRERRCRERGRAARLPAVSLPASWWFGSGSGIAQSLPASGAVRSCSHGAMQAPPIAV